MSNIINYEEEMKYSSTVYKKPSQGKVCGENID